MSLHRDPKPTTVIDVQVGWAEQRSTLPDRYLLISFGMYLPRPVFTATAHDDCHLYSVHAASSAQRHLPRPPCKVKTLSISLALVEWHCSSIKKMNAPDTWTPPHGMGFGLQLYYFGQPIWTNWLIVPRRLCVQQLKVAGLILIPCDIAAHLSPIAYPLFSTTLDDQLVWRAK